jgi:hypothetical protein
MDSWPLGATLVWTYGQGGFAFAGPIRYAADGPPSVACISFSGRGAPAVP